MENIQTDKVALLINHYTTSVFRYCPNCGLQNGRAETEKLFTCPDCDFRFYANPASAVGGILRNSAGEVLLVRRVKDPAKGKLNTPGGFVDPYESAEEGLVREILEEVAMKVTGMTFLASFPNIYTYRSVTYHTTDMFFFCDIGDAPEFVPNEEVAEILFVPPTAIDFDELAFESTKQAFREYLRILG